MRYKILLTDDEPLLRKVGMAMLKQLGHEVAGAKDGLEALDILEKDDSFDLLMTDLCMPEGISGEKLATEAQKLRPKMRIIFLSGYTDDRETTNVMPVYDIQFLAKPFTLEQLKEALEERFMVI